MNKAYDYNGVQIAPSRPVQKLTTYKRTVYLDSGDRDKAVYSTNGNYVVYLPRVYEKVVSLNVRGAEFPPISGAKSHLYSATGGTANDSSVSGYAIFLEIEGLNKSDETAIGADRSAHIDSVFAKFQLAGATGDATIYNESAGQKNIVYYQPPISKLDRLHLITRLHSQQGATAGYVYWADKEYGLTIDIETIENSFDDFSSFETRIGERSTNGYFSK
jgi:hypothetical protein